MSTDRLNLRRDEAALRSTAFTVREYRVHLDLGEATDPRTATFPSRVGITLDVHEKAGVGGAGVDTFADFVAESVELVLVNGEQREVEFDGARVQLRGLRPGAENTVEIAGRARYSRTGEGLHRFVDPADGLTYLYTQSEPTDSRRVFPQFDQPDLKAVLRMSVTGPAGWRLLGNGAETAREPAGVNSAGEDLTRVEFAPVGPISTFIMCVCAGPYEGFTDSWRGTVDGAELEIPLGMYVRRALASSFDPERLFAVTKGGLDYFHDAFGLPYPYGKYDSVFVPEYNLGAMENPGLVTFNDAAYVFEAGATASQYEARANTVMHEMSHMWFGNLVTPRWWDDLWLKESFADYMGVAANVAAGGHPTAWTPFAAVRSMWAYSQDQLPTTHPIVADIPDVQAAEQNFDGITYAKGAKVLKQLVHWVGEETFLEGSRAYFREHAWGSTGLDDFLGALSAAGGRDLRQWSRAWLETSGVGTLTPVLDHDGRTLHGLTVEQHSEPLRPHRLAVGLYRLRADSAAQAAGTDAATPCSAGPGAARSPVRLERVRRIDVEVTGARTPVPEAAGEPLPDLVLVNDDDLTYAKARLDPRSLATVRERLSALDSSLARALVWSALWNAARDAELPAADLIAVTDRHAPRESDMSLLTAALAHQRGAADHYTPPAEQARTDRFLVDQAWTQLQEAAPGSDAQLTWAREFARAASYVDSRADNVEQLLAGNTPRGLELTPDLRWRLLEALAATGAVGRERLDAERAADTTSLAPVRHLRALSSFPDAAVKQQTWQALLHETDASNDQVSARVHGFNRVRHERLLADYLDPFFETLTTLWAGRSQEIAQRIIRDGFPLAGTAAPGTAPEEYPGPRAAGRWLDTHPQAPGALRRLVLEGRDHQLRAVRAQQAATRDS